MGCKSCCDEPSQVVIERVALALINRLILEGKLQGGLKNCAGTMLAPGTFVATCEELECAKLRCDNGGTTVDIYLNAARLDGSTLVLTMNNNVVHRVDLSSLAGGGTDTNTLLTNLERVLTNTAGEYYVTIKTTDSDGKVLETQRIGIGRVFNVTPDWDFSTGKLPELNLEIVNPETGAITTTTQPLPYEHTKEIKFDDQTRTLTIVQSRGDSKPGAGDANDNVELTVTIPSDNRGIKGVEFNTVTRLLTITRDDDTQLTTVIPAGAGGGGTDNDTVISNFAVDGDDLVITMSDATEHRVTFPAGKVTAVAETSVGAGGMTSVDNVPLLPVKHTVTNSDGTDVDVILYRPLHSRVEGISDVANTQIIGDTTQGLVGYTLKQTFNAIDPASGQSAGTLDFAIPVLTQRISSFYRDGNELKIDTKVSDGVSNHDILRFRRTLSVELPASGGAPAFELSQDAPTPTNDTHLPTQMVGARTMALGGPDAWTEVTIGADTYWMPLYKKP